MKDKPRHQPCTGQERIALRDFLLAAGLTSPEVAQLLGGAEKHRSAIAIDLAAWLKTRPRAEP